MKIIKAKQSNTDRVAYINANRIDSFYATENDGHMETKIYFGDHKCFIDGDKTIEIAHFMCTDDDGGFLDLTVEEKSFRAKSYKNANESLASITKNIMEDDSNGTEK